ncbi:hypothetical protein [Georgenia deserti]|uniref:Uncharacterized protein n=1 Tax=Georgenia deserti TaxID=2093781 RepID=A0ABW4L4U0_9MICO
MGGELVADLLVQPGDEPFCRHRVPLLVVSPRRPGEDGALIVPRGCPRGGLSSHPRPFWRDVTGEPRPDGCHRLPAGCDLIVWCLVRESPFKRAHGEVHGLVVPPLVETCLGLVLVGEGDHRRGPFSACGFPAGERPLRRSARGVEEDIGVPISPPPVEDVGQAKCRRGSAGGCRATGTAKDRSAKPLGGVKLAKHPQPDDTLMIALRSEAGQRFDM